MRMVPSLKAQPPGRFAITSQTGYNHYRRGHVSEKEYTYYFTPERKDRFRYYHYLIGGRIVRFRIQYEALIGEGWHAIVRYDTAHGRPHQDVLHPDGSQDKVEFYGYSEAEVLTLGERDIKTNWQRYRAEYERELKR
jgi:superfamily II DNA or RNA helicase